MVEELIKPNWHVIANHYPIALLTVGLIVELIGAARRREGLRLAARWMIGLGAFLSVPTALLGAYAFRDTVTGGPISLHHAWSEIAAESHWGSEAFDIMTWHVWLNAGATVLFVAVAMSWIMLSPSGRRRFYAPLLFALVIGVSAMTAGSWFGGEMVYQHAAGVEPTPGAGAGAPGSADWVRASIPPLQLHLLLGGTMAALALVGLAQLFRARRLMDRTATVPASPDPNEVGAQPVTVVWRSRSLRGLWLFVCLGFLGGAVIGLWSMLGTFTPEKLQSFFDSLFEPEEPRVLAHAIVGVSIVLMTLVPIVAPRLVARRRGLASGFAVFLILLLGSQVYLGLQMLFDGHPGPLVGFREAGAASAEHDSDEASHAGEESASAAGDDGSLESTAAGDGSLPPADLVIEMTSDLTYAPASATVRVGDTVEWTNPSDMMHTVTARKDLAKDPGDVRLPEGAKPFHSGEIPAGKTWRHTFEVPGEYRYFCVPHERMAMIGELTVIED